MNAERQPTDTSSPMPVDVARDLLAVVRALEARVAVLESLLASAITPGALPTPEMIEAGFRVLKASCITEDLLEADRLTVAEILSAALRLPTVPDAYGRVKP